MSLLLSGWSAEWEEPCVLPRSSGHPAGGAAGGTQPRAESRSDRAPMLPKAARREQNCGAGSPAPPGTPQHLPGPPSNSRHLPGPPASSSTCQEPPASPGTSRDPPTTPDTSQHLPASAASPSTSQHLPAPPKASLASPSTSQHTPASSSTSQHLAAPPGIPQHLPGAAGGLRSKPGPPGLLRRGSCAIQWRRPGRSSAPGRREPGWAGTCGASPRGGSSAEAAGQGDALSPQHRSGCTWQSWGLRQMLLQEPRSPPGVLRGVSCHCHEGPGATCAEEMGDSTPREWTAMQVFPR